MEPGSVCRRWVGNANEEAVWKTEMIMGLLKAGCKDAIWIELA
jgi:hypothetical protein